MAGWKQKVIVTAAVLYVLLCMHDRLLNSKMPASIISSVCSAYEAGQVSGSLCSDLCEQNNIHFGKSLSKSRQKEVYDGEWRGKQAILKMNILWFTLFEEEQKNTDNEVLSSHQHYVSSYVETLFGNCSQCDKLTSHLLQLCDSNGDGIVTASEVRTFVSLLRLLEPMMLIMLNESQHSVNFYGYCGGLYVLEKMPFVASQVFEQQWEFPDVSILPDLLKPLEDVVKNFVRKIVDAAFTIPYLCTILYDILTLTNHILIAFSQTYIPTEKEKFEFLYSVLDATLSVSSNPYGMLQSCDLHLGNYGFTNNSVVKVIDFDQMYPVAHLTTFFEQKECASDNDCWVGNPEYCQSSCNTVTGTCEAVVWKQDLITICESQLPFIFMGPSILQQQRQNTTCLRAALGRLVVLCQQLPAIRSIQQLRHAVLVVKQKLEHIERNCT